MWLELWVDNMGRVAVSMNFIQSFRTGISLSGRKYTTDFGDERKRDYDALRSDWENVGIDIKSGTEQYRAQRTRS